MNTALIWDDALADYRFTPGHPLDPRRLQLTLSLIRRLDLVDDDAHRIVAARTATADEILAVHDAPYVDAVKRASDGAHSDAARGASLGASRTRHIDAAALLKFGLGTEDVPIVAGMHDAAAHIAGATLRAAELIATGDVTRAFSIAGGLHHARRAEAAGFCVYNDLAIAIRWLQRAHGMRVMCIDIDAHHGDGTQWIFYDDPDVLTVSFHESGAFLYPGTGFIDEAGEGDGYGRSVNVPLDPHTDDVSFMHAVRELVPALAEAYDPDIIVLQAGCDAHVLDPLTHLRCTTSLYHDAVRLVCDVAEKHCGGRVLATGGGGYAVHEVVPRAWTLVWAALCGADVADEMPADWVADVAREAGHDVPRTLRDAPDAFERLPLSADAELTNRQTVDAVRRRALPLLTGWGLAF